MTLTPLFILPMMVGCRNNLSAPKGKARSLDGHTSLACAYPRLYAVLGALTLIALVGCATKPIYVTPAPVRLDPFQRLALKRSLEFRYAQEDHKQERRALRVQLSMSKTNYVK